MTSFSPQMSNGSGTSNNITAPDSPLNIPYFFAAEVDLANFNKKLKGVVSYLITVSVRDACIRYASEKGKTVVCEIPFEKIKNVHASHVIGEVWIINLKGTGPTKELVKTVLEHKCDNYVERDLLVNYFQALLDEKDLMRAARIYGYGPHIMEGPCKKKGGYTYSERHLLLETGKLFIYRAPNKNKTRLFPPSYVIFLAGCHVTTNISSVVHLIVHTQKSKYELAFSTKAERDAWCRALVHEIDSCKLPEVDADMSRIKRHTPTTSTTTSTPSSSQPPSPRGGQSKTAPSSPRGGVLVSSAPLSSSPLAAATVPISSAAAASVAMPPRPAKPNIYNTVNGNFLQAQPIGSPKSHTRGASAQLPDMKQQQSPKQTRPTALSSAAGVPPLTINTTNTYANAGPPSPGGTIVYKYTPPGQQAPAGAVWPPPAPGQPSPAAALFPPPPLPPTSTSTSPSNASIHATALLPLHPKGRTHSQQESADIPLPPPPTDAPPSRQPRSRSRSPSPNPSGRSASASPNPRGNRTRSPSPSPCPSSSPAPPPTKKAVTLAVPDGTHTHARSASNTPTSSSSSPLAAAAASSASSETFARKAKKRESIIPGPPSEAPPDSDEDESESEEEEESEEQLYDRAKKIMEQKKLEHEAEKLKSKQADAVAADLKDRILAFRAGSHSRSGSAAPSPSRSRDNSSASAPKESSIKLPIIKEGEQSPMGFVDVQPSATLEQLRKIMGEEVDGMPVDYVILMSGGIPVGKRQESKTTVSSIGSHLSIRVLDAKAVAAASMATVEWTIFIKGSEDALGMIEIRDDKHEMVLSDVRTQIMDELDDVPEDFLFLVNDVPISKKQESRKLVSHLPPGRLVLKVRSAGGIHQSSPPTSHGSLHSHMALFPSSSPSSPVGSHETISRLRTISGSSVDFGTDSSIEAHMHTHTHTRTPSNVSNSSCASTLTPQKSDAAAAATSYVRARSASPGPPASAASIRAASPARSSSRSPSPAPASAAPAAPSAPHLSPSFAATIGSPKASPPHLALMNSIKAGPATLKKVTPRETSPRKMDGLAGALHLALANRRANVDGNDRPTASTAGAPAAAAAPAQPVVWD